MSKQIIIRIIFDVIIFFAVLNGYWFVALPFGIIGLWMFPYFVEIIIAGVIYDALFGMVEGTGWHGYLATIVSLLVTSAFLFVKRLVR